MIPGAADSVDRRGRVGKVPVVEASPSAACPSGISPLRVAAPAPSLSAVLRSRCPPCCIIAPRGLRETLAVYWRILLPEFALVLGCGGWGGRLGPGLVVLTGAAVTRERPQHPRTHPSSTSRDARRHRARRSRPWRGRCGRSIPGAAGDAHRQRQRFSLRRDELHCLRVRRTCALHRQLGGSKQWTSISLPVEASK
jgi:hypothetical protein